MLTSSFYEPKEKNFYYLVIQILCISHIWFFHLNKFNDFIENFSKCLVDDINKKDFLYPLYNENLMNPVTL